MTMHDGMVIKVAWWSATLMHHLFMEISLCDALICLPLVVLVLGSYLRRWSLALW